MSDPRTPLEEAMDRLSGYTDGSGFYVAWRGPTPVGKPSLQKDLLILLTHLSETGVFVGKLPTLDPLWNPS